MQKLKFIQYLMPDGKRKEQFIQVSEDISEKAKYIENASCRFEMELLSDYQTVSFTIFDEINECDVAIALCKNGPDVPTTIENMINSYYNSIKLHTSEV